MSETRANIVDLAERLIRTKGYNAFSYKDISTQLDIKNAAIHYHFPSKCDLGVAVIERNRIDFQAKTKEWLENSPASQLDKFIQIYRNSDESNMICFMGALGPAFNSLPSSMQEKLTTASQEIRDWLKEVLEKGKENDEFHFNETTEEKADLIVSSLLASLILNRVTGEDVFNNVTKAIQAEV